MSSIIEQEEQRQRDLVNEQQRRRIDTLIKNEAEHIAALEQEIDTAEETVRLLAIVRADVLNLSLNVSGSLVAIAHGERERGEGSTRARVPCVRSALLDCVAGASQSVAERIAVKVDKLEAAKVKHADLVQGRKQFE